MFQRAVLQSVSKYCSDVWQMHRRQLSTAQTSCWTQQTWPVRSHSRQRPQQFVTRVLTMRRNTPGREERAALKLRHTVLQFVRASELIKYPFHCTVDTLVPMATGSTKPHNIRPSLPYQLYYDCHYGNSADAHSLSCAHTRTHRQDEKETRHLHRNIQPSSSLLA